MYNGIEIDCSSDDGLVAGVCLQFEGERAFTKGDNGTLLFSLFAGVSHAYIFHI